MSKRNIFILTTSLFISLLLWGCKKGYDTSTLPKYQSGTASTTVVDSLMYFVTDTTGNTTENAIRVDFTKQYFSFQASISEPATWYIDIMSVTSGAMKRLSGFGTTIDSSNVKWYGDSDNLYYFSKGDSCIAKLTVLGTDLVSYSKSFSVLYSRLDSSFLLVADFEPYGGATDAAKFCPQHLYSDAQVEANKTGTQALVKAWNKFFDTENRDEEICGGYVFTNAEPGCDKNIACGGDILKAVNGVGYFMLKGQDYSDEPGNFFVGGFNHDPVLYGIDPTKTLEDLWVNFYVNSNGNQNTALKVKFYGIKGDEFTKEFEIDWKGWQLVKIKLSDLALENTGQSSPGKLVPSQIKRMGFEALCNKGVGSGCNIEVAVDYVTITYDKPFNPQLTY